MKNIRLFVGTMLLLLAGAWVSVLHPSASATELHVRKPMTEIGIIHFRGGRLVQSTEHFGRWYEKRNNGKINYEFLETDQSPTSIELTGPHGDVMLFVNLEAKTIQGKWPGQAPKLIYKITGLEKMDVVYDPCLPPAKPLPPCPVAPVPMTPPTFPHPPAATPPVDHPPVVIPPVTTPPVISPYVPLPKDLVSASYEGGQFMKVTDTVWQETLHTGESYHFQQVGYDENDLYLYDTSRQAFVALNPASSISRIAVGGAYLTSYKSLTAVSGQQETPIPTHPGGGLSEAEKLACVQSGGFVERAGLLGAERCTRPFSDAGLVCSDSSQCQGQCRTTVGNDAGTPVTGICQANDNPFGCFAEVVNGAAGPGLCVD